jgi:SAM-dependent methyltransferase
MMESNKDHKQQAFEPLRISAERILSVALGNQIHINKIERLTEKGRRNLLLRCLSHPTNGSPASFILKKVETEDYNPDEADSWDTRRFFNDWVGSQFLSTIPSNFQHSPHFYGGDRQLGFGATDRIEVKTADMRQLPFPDSSFDIVVSSWAVHNLEIESDHHQALDEIIRVLKPNGSVVLADIVNQAEYAEYFDQHGMAKVHLHNNPIRDAVLKAVSFGSFAPSAVSASKNGLSAVDCASSGLTPGKTYRDRVDQTISLADDFIYLCWV